MELERIIKAKISEYIADKIGGKFGLSKEESQSVISEFITMFLGKMRENSTKSPETTMPLFDAVRDDHDGSVLDNVDKVISHSESFSGAKIIEHIFGKDGSGVETLLSKHTNIPTDQATKIAKVVAPLIMGVLGKEQHDQDMDIKTFEKLLQK